MNFENTKVMNFDGAIRGMRNPLESWDKSDSAFGYCDMQKQQSTIIPDMKLVMDRQKDKLGDDELEFYDEFPGGEPELLDFLFKNSIVHFGQNNEEDGGLIEYCLIGPNDLDLMQRLVRGGSSHRKFLRQIFVCVDITAPLYWWKEFDTYKIGTVANSTSTMHKLATTPIFEGLFENNGEHLTRQERDFMDYLEHLRQEYLKTKDKAIWKRLIRNLPESWCQTRTVTMSYENIRNIVNQRENHKLTEWSNDFIDWAKTLPYADKLIFYCNSNQPRLCGPEFK